MTTDKKIAAFFDIDGTLFRNSLMVSHFNKLIQYEILSSDLKEQIQPFYSAWHNRELDYDDYLQQLARVYTDHLRDKPMADIDFAAKQTVELEHKHLYRFTKEQLDWHKSQEHLIVFISGSPQFLVSRMAKKLGSDMWFATEYLSESGKFNGQVIPMWDSSSKLSVIKKLANEYHIDLTESYAYGDTNGDVAMLANVGHGVAFNPNKKLVTSLKNHDVEIVVERKDIIYRGISTKNAT